MARVLVLALLAGCVAPTRYTNRHPGRSNQATFDVDRYECQREALVLLGNPRSIGESISFSEMHDQCMAARGWREVQGR